MSNTFKDIFPISIENLITFSEESIKSDSFEILFSTFNEQGVIVNNNVYTMNSYDIIVINPYTTYKFFHNNREIIRIKINHSLFNTLFNDLPSIECNSCNYKNKERFRPIYVAIIRYIKAYKNITLANAYSIAYHFIDTLVTNFKSSTSVSKAKNRLLEITSYIENNYQDNLLLNDIAFHFNMSVPYLSKLFKQELGTNFAAYYDDLRLSNSLYEILNTDTPILEIALKHGFANKQAFTRAYKKKYNELPSQTRRNYKKTNVDAAEEVVAFTSILKTLENSEVRINEYQDSNLETSYYTKTVINYSHNYKSVLGIGNAKILLYDNLRQLVTKFQRNIGFTYAHIRGILADELSVCSRSSHGELIFRFSLIDEIIDFLVTHNFIPIMSLTYMPDVLASDKTKVIYNDNVNTSAPKDLSEWQLTVKTLINHFIERYDFELVDKFVFIPWVSPDSSYNQMGFGNDDLFNQFYLATYQAIKEVSPNSRILSPEIFPDCEENFVWLKNFMNFAKKNNCLPEGMALQFFSDDNWGQVESQSLKGRFLYSLRDYGMRQDDDAMHKYLTKINKFLNAEGYQIPIGITSFNYTIKRNNPIQDTLFMANYVLKNYVDNFEFIKAYTYWNLCDFDNTTTASTLFFGGSGLFFANGIPKPQAQAYLLLKFVEDDVIMRGDGYIVSRNLKTNNLYLILYNYEHPFLADESQNVNLKNDVYNAFPEKIKKRINFKLRDCHFSKAFFKIYTINQTNGSAYDKWVSMGKPSTDQFYLKDNIIFNNLSSAANCNYKELRKDLNDNTLTIDFTLDPLEIKGIQIKLK